MPRSSRSMHRAHRAATQTTKNRGRRGRHDPKPPDIASGNRQTSPCLEDVQNAAACSTTCAARPSATRTSDSPSTARASAGTFNAAAIGASRRRGEGGRAGTRDTGSGIRLDRSTAPSAFRQSESWGFPRASGADTGPVWRPCRWCRQSAVFRRMFPSGRGSTL